MIIIGHCISESVVELNQSLFSLFQQIRDKFIIIITKHLEVKKNTINWTYYS